MKTYRIACLSLSRAARGEVFFVHTAADAAYYRSTGRHSVVQVANEYLPSDVAAQLPCPDFSDF